MGEGKRRRFRPGPPVMADTDTVEKLQRASKGLYRVTLFGVGLLSDAAQKLNTPEEKDMAPEMMRTLFGTLEVMAEIDRGNGMQCACCDDIQFGRSSVEKPAAFLLIEAGEGSGQVATLSPICEDCAERPDATIRVVRRIQPDARLVHADAGHV